MSTKRQWSILWVQQHKGRMEFRHGSFRFNHLPAVSLNLGSLVQVFRAGELIDKGKVDMVGGHDGSWRFFGLDKVVPKDQKRSAAPPMTTGFVGELLPAWFEEGDIIRMQVPSSRFRAWMHVWREF